MGEKKIVKGQLSKLLEGIGCMVSYNEIIGKPIKDSSGRTIGVITNVIPENDIWIGEADLSLVLKSQIEQSVEKYGYGYGSGYK